MMAVTVECLNVKRSTVTRCLLVDATFDLSIQPWTKPSRSYAIIIFRRNATFWLLDGTEFRFATVFTTGLSLNTSALSQLDL